ncbi:agamous-like MADS-box protein AGL30 [Durio zibethinus]|uniref:Agamous-like MADS-box protein AGL30 n=1 Tax=Durio zibethinus TaxID=66656 RepID=A0A6P5X949_DURZI|nr:agamous-like MADS-box protein AGL30 [Durio zibethinus]
MGRVKLKIKKLENTNGRQATYAKRKHGIMKKANELSILCDVEIILLMFSPTNKPSVCIGKRSSIEDIIEKFAQLTPQERAKRKLESFEALKKTFKKLDHDVNIHEFLGTSTQTIEDLTNQARLLQTRLSDIHRRLSCWTNIDKINNVEHLGQMEDSLKEYLNQIRAHMENLGKQQLLSFECTSQFQNEMHVPFRMGIEQQLQPLAWVPNNDSRHMALSEDPNLFPHRDVECSASSSFGSYSGYFGTAKSSELSSSGQENSILNDLGGNASLQLQLGGQCPFFSYNLNILNDPKFPPVAEMNFQETPADYHVNGALLSPRAGYDATQGSWASTSGPCAVTMFDEPLYSRVSLSLLLPLCFQCLSNIACVYLQLQRD